MDIPLNKPPLYLFVFGGVMVQYNLHYLIKETSHPDSAHFIWSGKNRKAHFFLIAAGTLLIFAGLYGFTLYRVVILSLLGIVTLLYSLPVLPFSRKRLKDFGVLKIITLVLFWTLITVWLPAGRFGHTNGSFIIIFVSRFIFLFALCLVFDIRDTETDAKENIRTIPIIIGVRKTYLLVYILLAAFILLAIIQHLLSPGILHLNALIISGAAAFVMIDYVKKNKSDLAYLACIDGIMLLQALLVFIASI